MRTSEAVLRIKVQKKNPAGEVVYEYEGDELRRDDTSIVQTGFGTTNNANMTRKADERNLLFIVNYGKVSSF